MGFLMRLIQFLNNILVRLGRLVKLPHKRKCCAVEGSLRLKDPSWSWIGVGLKWALSEGRTEPLFL